MSDEKILNPLVEMMEGIKKMMEEQGKTDNDDYAELCANIEEMKNGKLDFGDDTVH